MTNRKDNEPMYILPEGTQRNTGKSAQKMNILAARLVAETVRSTLGPKGMDKMLVDPMGQITVTNDGVTILKELNVDHPSARMVIEIAKTQEEEVGDGTTTAVVLAGEMLKKAEELLNSGIHPTIIAKGYRLASHEAIKILNELAKDILPEDKKTLIKIAETAMTGKGAEENKETLSKLIVEGLTEIAKHPETDLRESITIKRKTGNDASESELIKGVIIDKEKTHPDMPSKITGAKILLLDSPLEIKSTAADAKISINTPEMMQSFIDTEEKTLKLLVEKVKKTGANALFCQKGIDDLAQYFLAKQGIYAVRRVKRSDMKKLSQATGAKIISDLDETENALGTAGIIEQIKTGEDYITLIKECKNPRALSILIKGSTSHVADETARAVEDAIGDVAAVIQSKKAVPGAGSTEAELARKLKIFANTLKGREQLAAQSFAESFEIIPKTLAENAGLDPINVLAELKHAHDAGKTNEGINVFTGKLMNAWEEGVIEPLKIKVQAINSATEVATMILRIDDVILSGAEDKKQNNEPDEM
jgi:archaeal chaperonin